MSGKKILLATIGSLGDLHPMLALATELSCRGHYPTIATTPFYKERILALGIGFQPLRPNWDPTDGALIAQCQEIKRGPEILFRQLILPHLRDTYADLHAATEGADLMLAGELVYAAPLVAEKCELPWASVILSPTSFFSAYDPSLLVNMPALYRLRNAGWLVNRVLLETGKLVNRHWWNPVRDLRRELGIRRQCDPIFRDKFSPDLVLALFSKAFAQPQEDWPQQTIQPGFIFYDRNQESTESAELNAFLSRGDPPLVFTQGSTAVHHPGSFYETSVAAARKLNRRAVLIGTDRSTDDQDLFRVSYASYAQVFPHAAAIVHQGGSGTTAQALRAGRPQLIVPFGWDQPDNGVRIERLGAGICLSRQTYTASSAAAALKRLLEQTSYTETAQRAQRQLSDEMSLHVACDAVETLLSRIAENGAEK